jgi:hypothetical protein
MSGGNKVVGLWRDADAAPQRDNDSGDALIATMELTEAVEDDAFNEELPSERRSKAITAIATLSALTWLGALGWERYTLLGTARWGVSDIVSLIATASAPLALIAVIWLLVQRSGRAEQRRFARSSALLDRDARRLQSLFALINQRVEEARGALTAQSDSLMALGDDAAARLNSITRAMDAEIETVGRHTQQLTGSAAAARGDLAVLLSSLPKANVQTRQMIASLQEAGLAAHEHAGALDAQLALLQKRGEDANEVAGTAAQKLAAHLARMESVGEVAGARLEAAAGQMTEAVDAALERAAQALDVARQGMEAQGAAMMALVEQSHGAMAKAGDEAAHSLASRVTDISERIAAVAQSFAREDERAAALVRRLQSDFEALETRFAEFDSGGSARIERLGMAIQALRDHSSDMTSALTGSGDAANVLVERVQSLITALDAAQREVDETLSPAFGRVEETAQRAVASVTSAAPEIERLGSLAGAASERLEEMAAMVARQAADLDALASRGTGDLDRCRSAAEAIGRMIEEVRVTSERLSTETAPRMQSALAAIRDEAEATGAATRKALDAAIDGAAAEFDTRSRQALGDALTRETERQMAAIASTTERAVGSAQLATDRLMRQLLTISETSAALEARIADAKAEIERSDQGNFARRVALLIESLNSTAIDVTKILSNEVTDTAWASYLRGDRGVFSRRAVRLLDASEARAVGHHYEHDAEFREHVNRYIHDFEAMLRQVLSTRDGSLLGVTLLSSDNGKLYVALAQAIERLRV